jgi:hypothetical protein
MEVWPDGSAIELEDHDIQISVHGLMIAVLPAMLPSKVVSAIFASRGDQAVDRLVTAPPQHYLKPEGPEQFRLRPLRPKPPPPAHVLPKAIAEPHRGVPTEQPSQNDARNDVMRAPERRQQRSDCEKTAQ